MTLSPDVIAAFFSGVAAVVSAVASSRVARKRAERECRERIEEVRSAMHEGYEMGRQ